MVRAAARHRGHHRGGLGAQRLGQPLYLAGTVLQNQDLATNVLNIAANLSITTSNLNRAGLWGILWSHKPAANKDPAKSRK